MNIKDTMSSYESLLLKGKEDKLSCDYLLELFSSYNRDYHALAEIEKAYEFAYAMHANVLRNSGERYIVHPLNVAIILAKMHADKDTICAALLHDVIEDTGTTKLNLAMIFNQNIAHYVDGVSKLEINENGTQKLSNSDYMRKLITSSREDLEVLLIKLADKLHNMRTLNYKDREKQIETSLETLSLFAPLAEKIGLYQVKKDLEDLSLLYLAPDKYKIIDDYIKTELEKRRFNTFGIIREIDDCLNAIGVNHEIKCSCKNIYGIYKLIENEIKDIDDPTEIGKILDEKNIHDLLSIQLIVDSEKDCYEANNLINSLYKICTQESKDYIKNPKANMYESLHTTIKTDDKLLQIQIRTPNMDKIANYGISAYWDISGPFAKKDMLEAIKINIAKPIHAIDRIYEDSDEFLDHIKTEMLEDNIEVYTPTNQPIDLPQGSTVIDFAYQIHTEIGNEMVAAFVNGKLQSIYYILKPDDVVEVVTHKDINLIYSSSTLYQNEYKQILQMEQTYPNEEWLDHIKTTRAKKKINEFLRKPVEEKNKEKVLEYKKSIN